MVCGLLGRGGALVVLQSNLVIKQNILSNVSKCMQKQEEEKKKKANKQQLHTPIKNHNISFQLKLLYLNSALLLGGVCVVRLGV